MHTNIRYNYYMIIINYDFTNNSIDNFILIFIARILNVMSCIEWTNEMLAGIIRKSSRKSSKFREFWQNCPKNAPN